MIVGERGDVVSVVTELDAAECWSAEQGLWVGRQRRELMWFGKREGGDCW